MMWNPARAWNILYSLAVENLDKKEREKFDSELFRRPRGETRGTGDAFDIALMKGAEAYLKAREQSISAIESKETVEG